jgi:mevalonate kinase
MVKSSDNQIYFPAKILLFGEYGIVSGWSGIAIPFHRFSGQLEPLDFSQITPRSEQSYTSISLLANQLRKQKDDFDFLDIERFSGDMKKGLWFDSTIPTGYGLGSSGALIAAIYSQYRKFLSEDTAIVRDHLARMENFFHGSSSGIDPSVSFFQEPIVVTESGISVLKNFSLPNLGLSIFLVDTGVSAKTIQLVDWFKSKMVQQEFRHRTEEDFLKINQSFVEKLSNHEPLVVDDLWVLSHYQLEYLSPMVPDSFRSHFFAGLNSREFIFKLCGSGGGGYMLCFATNRSKAIDYFSKTKLDYIEVR